jgi:uncharacterized protein
MVPTTESVRNLVEDIAKCLVDHPEFVQVKAVESAQATVFELNTHPSDGGKVIGREGRLVNAIRAILFAAGPRNHKTYRLEVSANGHRSASAGAED